MPDERAPLRYVVLRHEGVAEPHFDLMFETSPGSRLRTWRASRWPVEDGDRLVEIGLHRSAYLDYEGAVSNDRGRVARVHAGDCAVLEAGDARFAVTCRDGLELELVREADGSWRCRIRSM